MVNDVFWEIMNQWATESVAMISARDASSASDIYNLFSKYILVCES